MYTPTLTHPISGQGLVSRRDSYDRFASPNRDLQNEMSQVIDSFQAADNRPSDLEPQENLVRLRSPKGRNETVFASSYRMEREMYRDREGYLESTIVKTLTNASYDRVEYGADGQPNRKVNLSYVETGDGSLISKTVVDKNGTSVAVGGSARSYAVNYYPGDTIDAQA
jgi:hypothetical protein